MQQLTYDITVIHVHKEKMRKIITGLLWRYEINHIV